MHEKASYGGQILHGTAGSWRKSVLAGPRGRWGGWRGQVEGRGRRVIRQLPVRLRCYAGQQSYDF